MKVIIEKNIQGKLAQLILQGDGVTLEVMYDGRCILSSGGKTFVNLSDSDMFEDYLDMLVDSYLNDKKTEEEFEKVCKEIGWD